MPDPPPACLISYCDVWAQPGSPLCRVHAKRWREHGRPDPAEFARSCETPRRAPGIEHADLGSLPRQLRLELQYALQQRRDDNTATTHPVDIRAVARVLAASGAASLLALGEREWRSRLPSWADKSGQRAALLAYAHRQVAALAEGPAGWDSEYPRDTWRLRNLGITASASNAIATLRFGGISQPWLKDLAKRWTRWRISTGTSMSACYQGIRAVTRFSAFAARAGVQGPHQADRDLLERYLASLHRELAGNTRELQGSVGELSTFLLAVRRHGWEPTLPATAIIFPEDYPKPARPLPRALAAHVMAQAEDPANLDRWTSPAYRLITVILIRCGLRISSAVTLPPGCVATDVDGTPYLRYHNTKMKREALVPIDDELQSMITAQQDRNRERWPAGTPVLFPRPHANIDGTRPVSTGSYRSALRSWLERCDIRDEHGQPVRLTPHQWRHTLGTTLINRDVPQHVVQKILDHDSPDMTAHYARLSDKTVREHWDKARKVGATGQPVRISPDGPLGDAAWARHRLSRATQALPNGYCQLPLVQTCPHANSCLTCPMFVTTAEFLPQHRAQRQATLAAHHRRRNQRPRPRCRDEQAGRRQPGQDHHRARRRRGQPPGSGRCLLKPPPRSRQQPPAGTSSPAPGPSRRFASSTGPARPSPSPPSPRAAGISRSWLYTQPDIRDQIRQLRGTRSPRPRPARSPPASGQPTPRCAPGSPAALQRNQQLAEENARLRRQLARALGDQRSTRTRSGNNPAP